MSLQELTHALQSVQNEMKALIESYEHGRILHLGFYTLLSRETQCWQVLTYECTS